MQIEGIVAFLLIGAIAGWLAGKLMQGGGFGLVKNIVLGIIGAFIGGTMFSAVGITAGGLLGTIVISTVGAAVVLFVADMFKK